MSNNNFETWFKAKNFYFIEQMKEEFRPEYYCRSAYFSRDEEVKNLETKNSQLDDALKISKNLLEKGKITIDNLSIEDYSMLYDKSKEDIDTMMLEIKNLASFLNPNNCRSGTGVEEEILKTIKEKYKC